MSVCHETSRANASADGSCDIEVLDGSAIGVVERSHCLCGSAYGVGQLANQFVVVTIVYSTEFLVIWIACDTDALCDFDCTILLEVLACKKIVGRNGLYHLADRVPVGSGLNLVWIFLRTAALPCNSVDDILCYCVGSADGIFVARRSDLVAVYVYVAEGHTVLCCPEVELEVVSTLCIPLTVDSYLWLVVELDAADVI